MEELNQEIEEQKLIKKIKRKKRVRGFLIALNSLLIIYLALGVTYDIIGRIRYQEDNVDFVTLYSNSKEKSMELYDQYLLKENGKYVTSQMNDYALYGTSLHLSDKKMTPGFFSSLDSIYLRRVKNYKEKIDVAYNSKNNKGVYRQFVDGGLQLSTLEPGDYILLDDNVIESNYKEQHKAISLTLKENIDTAVYTLPNEEGFRKEIRFKSKITSPCIVISVTEVKHLPKDTYDLVLWGAPTSFKDALPENYNYIEVDSIQEAYQAKATYCFVFDDSYSEASILGSKYLQDEDIAKEEENAIIRECGGYILDAGTSNTNEAIAVMPYVGSHDKGKYTLILHQDVTWENVISKIR